LIRIHGRTVQQDVKIAADIRQTRAGTGVVFQRFNLVVIDWISARIRKSVT
jgi:ABC-type polar amino acid transport system ATPase subunit